jgi:hypothetical protein
VKLNAYLLVTSLFICLSLTAAKRPASQPAGGPDFSGEPAAKRARSAHTSEAALFAVDPMGTTYHQCINIGEIPFYQNLYGDQAVTMYLQTGKQMIVAPTLAHYLQSNPQVIIDRFPFVDDISIENACF